ncbi:MAG: JAB domain-containing protein [Lactobacillus sp.]|nr:JAB domain-containing protein [Lactobacillus sp.]
MDYPIYEKALISTDQELFTWFKEALFDQGIYDFEDLAVFLQKNQIESFEQFFKYIKGPYCPKDLAVTTESLIERIHEVIPKELPEVLSLESLGKYFSKQLSYLQHEEFWGIYVNRSGRVVAKKKLFVGTFDRTVVHPREIISWACLYGAKGVFICHNHPSGNLTPSQADMKTTERLSKTLKLVDLQLLDHFIVGQGKYMSFVEQHLLELV